MKNLMLSVACLVISGLLLASCGKSADQKKLEGDLNKQIASMHDAQMAKVKQLRKLEAQLDSVSTMHDSLSAAHPKEAQGHGRADLDQAKQKLAAARDAMDSWMSSFKPYDEKAGHEQAMAQLNKEAQGLTAVGTQMDSAIVDATGTIEAHRKAAADLLAKTAKPGKKGKR